MKIESTIPVLCVSSIEESLPFWTGILGYAKTVEVPHQNRIGFVILEKNGSQVMLQTHESLLADLPEVAKRLKHGSILLYSSVDSLEKTLAHLKGFALLVPPRTTFYGAKEIYIEDPDGNILGFAEHTD